jgi:hypothetical protein
MWAAVLYSVFHAGARNPERECLLAGTQSQEGGSLGPDQPPAPPHFNQTWRILSAGAYLELAVEIHDTILIKLLGVEKELSQKRRFRQQKMSQKFCLYLQTTALHVSLRGEERRGITIAIAHERSSRAAGDQWSEVVPAGSCQH